LDLDVQLDAHCVNFKLIFVVSAYITCSAAKSLFRFCISILIRCNYIQDITKCQEFTK
jgi:hypothetical protein